MQKYWAAISFWQSFLNLGRFHAVHSAVKAFFRHPSQHSDTHPHAAKVSTNAYLPCCKFVSGLIEYYGWDVTLG
jgi:hypothetical protein